MRRIASTLIGLSLFALSLGQEAEPKPIGPGSPAPKLEVATWYKGAPVAGFEKGKTYVVEFWATWCGPCIESIPHVTKLAKANPDVTFIGVSIWEDDKDGNIKQFIDKMGDKMDYNVGYSANQTGMAKSWMEAASQNGIPAAFVVKDEQIYWVGHPMELDKPLAQIKSGKFDLVGFKKKFDKEADETRLQIAGNKEIAKVIGLRQQGKKEEAKVALGEVVKQYPSTAQSADSIQFEWLATDDVRAWETAAKAKLKARKPDGAVEVASFALRQAQKPQGKALAKQAIEWVQKSRHRNDFMVLYYSLNVFERLTDDASALETVTRLLKGYDKGPAKANAELKKSFESKRAALEKKLASH